MKDMTVADNIVVSLAYTLHLDNGELIDEAESAEPLEYIHGLGHIIPGLETALHGLAVGEKKKVSVTAADAYGEPNPENYETVPRSIFPDDLELVEGMGLRMVDSETKEPVEAFVAEIGAEEVLLDFNHALAGETLHFAVEVVGLRPASADELDHGHVHGGHAH